MAQRAVAGLLPTSTICALPSLSKCVNSAMIFFLYLVVYLAVYLAFIPLFMRLG
jgi:hypothetical protein